jgi:hypothetical protein
MYVVRPVETADIAALESLAAVSMPGVHTLPKTPEKIEQAVERSIASFSAHVDIPSEESYIAGRPEDRRHRRHPRFRRFERHLLLLPQRRDPAGVARPEHQP